MATRITAPRKATMIEPTNPAVPAMPNSDSTQPPIRAPAMPTTTSASKPKPAPVITWPASQPAIAPTISHAMIPPGSRFIATSPRPLRVHRVACSVDLFARHRRGVFLDLARTVEHRGGVVTRLRRQRVEPVAHVVRAAEPEHVRRDGRRRREPDEEPLRHGAP